MNYIKPSNTTIIFSLLGGMILLFIVAPLIKMFLSCTPQQLTNTVMEPDVVKSIWVTLCTSMGATIIASIGAIPLAYILARKEFTAKRFLNGLIDIPIVIPHSAAGIALLGIISRGTFVGDAADMVGIKFVGGYAGIMIAMAYISIPFLINSARDGFAAVPIRLEKAALNLGASPIRVFLTISLPLARRSIISGLILMWARGMSEFGAVLIIAYHPMTTPVLIYERFGAFGLKYARPVSVIFILICLSIFILFRLFSGKKSYDRVTKY